MIEQMWALLCNVTGEQSPEWKRIWEEVNAQYCHLQSLPNSVEVQGRHAVGGSKRPKFVATMTQKDDGTLIRVDDENHLDFWLEILVTGR